MFPASELKILPYNRIVLDLNGLSPADLLAKVYNLWQAGDELAARELHRRLLPLIQLETHPFMRYILKRRGVFTTTVERAPSALTALDANDKREISTLIEAIASDVESFPFGPE